MGLKLETGKIVTAPDPDQFFYSYEYGPSNRNLRRMRVHPSSSGHEELKSSKTK